MTATVMNLRHIEFTGHEAARFVFLEWFCGAQNGPTVKKSRGARLVVGAGGGNRTHDLGIMRPSLYH